MVLKRLIRQHLEWIRPFENRVTQPKRTLSSRALKGNGAVFGVGAMIGTLTFSVLAIDLPIYFNTQNQLQTTVNSAALAAAAKLPYGEDAATETAYEYVDQNPVAGHTVSHGDVNLGFNGNRVSIGASTPVDTLMGKMLCALRGDFQGDDEESQTCDSMTVYAGAKAQPAARDTVLVIDTSSSMQSLGNMQPLNDVKSAARAFVDRVEELDNESVDHISLVSFDRYAATRRTLTDNYDDVRDEITDMPIYGGGGWNTNYMAGLKNALDELEDNGRTNAEKTVIFLTDGYPNLPEVSGSWNHSISKCIYYYNRRWRNSAKSCAVNYTDHFVDATTGQVDRAANMDATIHTIQIGGSYSNSLNTMRILLQDSDWDAGLLDEMAYTTDGDQYTADSYDADAILEIYNQVAQDIHLKLTS